MPAPFNRPDERRLREDPVKRVDGRAERQQHPHRIRIPSHRRAMKRGDVVLVLRMRIEAARQHRLEHRRVPAFGVTMEHEVVFRTELRAERRMSPEHRLRAGAVTARAAGGKPLGC